MNGRSGDSQTLTLGDHLYEHLIADPNCDQGWCGAQGYPHRCENEGCSGLVHADFGDESADGDYWLYTKCDVCGDSE